MMVVDVDTEGALEVGRPARLFDIAFVYTGDQAFDISEDGRFISVTNVHSPDYKKFS